MPSSLSGPTVEAMRRVYQGDGASAVAAAQHVAVRGALIGAGLQLSGQRQDVLTDALVASLTVQAFVAAWAALSPKGDLPSELAIKSGSLASMLLTTGLRAGIIGLGLRLAGVRTGVTRKALIAASAIEAGALAAAMYQRAGDVSLFAKPLLDRMTVTEAGT